MEENTVLDGITFRNWNKTGLADLIVFFCLQWLLMYLVPALVLFRFLNKGQVKPLCAASAGEFCSSFLIFLVPSYALGFEAYVWGSVISF